MKNWIIILFLTIAGSIFGQNKNFELELKVIKETLPQVLNANPNSIASYLKGGGMYEMLRNSVHYLPKMDGNADTIQIINELDKTSDSITKILEDNKILVLLSDTLFAYKYSPTYTYYNDGWVDTFDLRIRENWQIEYEDLVEVFQTNYEFRGLSTPVDLEFTKLIKGHICSKDTMDIPLDLNKLSSSHYSYTSSLPANHDTLFKQGLLVNGIRLYKPVFNKSKGKACYLFSFQARNGPWREFVFIEKRGKNWYFVESYGSEHVDGNEKWNK